MKIEETAIAPNASLNKGMRVLPFAVIVLVVALLPLVASSYSQGIMTKFLIYAIFAMSLDLIYGYTGMASLGHAAYFGMGGYVVALLMYHFEIKLLWIALPLGVATAAATAAVFGLIALRVKGIYFLLITFALGQLLFSASWNIKWFSVPGVQGITGLSSPDVGFPFRWTELRLYYLVFVGAVAVYFILYRLTRSPFGLALCGVREGPRRMRALGYNVWNHKYLAFIVAAAIAGLSGVLFAYYNQFVAPGMFGVEISFIVMCMVIIGGRGTLYGPIIGAAIIVFAEHYASSVTPERWPLILGAIFVAAILFARDGVGPYLLKLWQRALGRWVAEDFDDSEDQQVLSGAGKEVSPR